MNSKSNFLLFQAQHLSTLKSLLSLLYEKLVTKGTCGQTWLSSFSTFCLKDKVSWSVLRAVILPLSVQSKTQLIQCKTNQLWFWLWSTFCLKDKVSWSVLRAVILPLSVQSKIQPIQSKIYLLEVLYAVWIYFSKFNTLYPMYMYHFLLLVAFKM